LEHAVADEEHLGERAISEAVKDVIDRVSSFEDGTRRRIFRAALAFYGLDALSATEPHLTRPTVVNPAHPPQSSSAPTFSERQELSPKQFLFQKQPRTDVDRVACLAYYLTHYRDSKHFKTIDISQLNTEAAQVKFSNTAYAVVNAVNAGLLASAGQGFKQLSAMGERYVEALPDYNAAKEVIASMRKRRSRKSRGNHAELG
jgi:hypothetical protein